MSDVRDVLNKYTDVIIEHKHEFIQRFCTTNGTDIRWITFNSAQVVCGVLVPTMSHRPMEIIYTVPFDNFVEWMEEKERGDESASETAT